MHGPNTYLIRPNYQDKFKPATVKGCIHEILREQLSGVQYDPDNVQELTRLLAESIKDKVKRCRPSVCGTLTRTVTQKMFS
uniref:Tctex1 domain containing 2 n=1 Tax=Iconisemion striatum TaxID=60296 RepID=A0A1A7WZW9_9TELE